MQVLAFAVCVLGFISFPTHPTLPRPSNASFTSIPVTPSSSDGLLLSSYNSTSTGIGPKRIQPPPVPLDQLPEIDAVVISHNHYDRTLPSPSCSYPPLTLLTDPFPPADLDVATLTHIYKTQRPGSVHFFAPLGNAKWFKSVIGVKEDEVSEMDWWEERKLSVGEKGEKDAVGGSLRIVCTPCQHVRPSVPFPVVGTMALMLTKSFPTAVHRSFSH